MKKIYSLILFPLLLSVTGCGKALIKDSAYCVADAPIRYTMENVDKASDKLVDEIYTHNCRYYSHCDREKYKINCE